MWHRQEITPAAALRRNRWTQICRGYGRQQMPFGNPTSVCQASGAGPESNDFESATWARSHTPWPSALECRWKRVVADSDRSRQAQRLSTRPQRQHSDRELRGPLARQRLVRGGNQLQPRGGLSPAHRATGPNPGVGRVQRDERHIPRRRGADLFTADVRLIELNQDGAPISAPFQPGLRMVWPIVSARSDGPVWRIFGDVPHPSGSRFTFGSMEIVSAVGGGCRTPNPFVAFGGGRCVNGGWLFPTVPAPPPSAPVPGIPDPFIALGEAPRGAGDTTEAIAGGPVTG